MNYPYRVSDLLPRKGTETNGVEKLFDEFGFFRSFRPLTPKGDGLPRKGTETFFGIIKAGFALGITTRTVQHWEAGESIPNLEPVQTFRLCKLLQCSAEDLARYFSSEDFTQDKESPLAELRKKVGLTQAKLAEALDVRQGTISDWEGGLAIPHLTPSKLKQMMETLECTLDELIEACEQVP